MLIKLKCFSRALIGYSTSGYPVLFTDSPPAPPSERRQTRVRYEQNGFPVYRRSKRTNFTNNQTNCSRNTRIKKMRKFGLEVLTCKALSI